MGPGPQETAGGAVSTRRLLSRVDVVFLVLGVRWDTRIWKDSQISPTYLYG